MTAPPRHDSPASAPGAFTGRTALLFLLAPLASLPVWLALALLVHLANPGQDEAGELISWLVKLAALTYLPIALILGWRHARRRRQGRPSGRMLLGGALAWGLLTTLFWQQVTLVPLGSPAGLGLLLTGLLMGLCTGAALAFGTRRGAGAMTR